MRAFLFLVIALSAAALGSLLLASSHLGVEHAHELAMEKLVALRAWRPESLLDRMQADGEYTPLSVGMRGVAPTEPHGGGPSPNSWEEPGPEPGPAEPPRPAATAAAAAPRLPSPLHKEGQLFADSIKQMRLNVAPPPTPNGTYRCLNTAESYTAGFLVSRRHFLTAVNVQRLTGTAKTDNATWLSPLLGGAHVTLGKHTNMEAASLSVVAPAARAGRGSLKTLDAWDFFYDHLSMYERRLGLMTMPAEAKALVTADMVRQLKGRADDLRGFSRDAERTAPRPCRECGAAVAVMPVFFGGVGSGHSAPATRRAYLDLTYHSIVASGFPHVAVAVCTQEDADYVRGLEGIEWAHVVLIEGLERPSFMGAATVLMVQHLLRTKPDAWPYKYVYYTESDQVLWMRDPQRLLDLVAGGRDVVVPHRFSPFPTRGDFSEETLAALRSDRRTAGAWRELTGNGDKGVDVVTDIHRTSCCYDRGDCSTRDHWVHWSDPALRLFRFGAHGFATTQGEGNLFEHRWRHCVYRAEGRGCE